jgi:soluble P-type ATPase
MIEVEIPGWHVLRLQHLVLDVNGTIALDGVLLPTVEERIAILRSPLNIHLISADTHGGLNGIASQLSVHAIRVRQGESEAEQKALFLRKLGTESVVAVGNGANGVAMLKEAALSIAVVGQEGLATEALEAADVVVLSIEDGLDLLVNPRRLVASLRR